MGIVYASDPNKKFIQHSSPWSLATNEGVVTDVVTQICSRYKCVAKMERRILRWMALSKNSKFTWR
jgi:hypothetical protein